jgi:DNA (cytosine-5)-methyltransferase 1
MAVRVIHDTGDLFSQGDVTDRPSPAVLAQRMDFQVIRDSRPEPQRRPDLSKPVYRVPSLAETNALPWNGFKVASTFSGCGGSCLGYRMAGFRVVWANEFVPIAQESYKANAARDCILDGRDIKQVKPEEILAVTGLAQGELDLFDGSPPCQAFSTAGKREKGWGKAKAYEHGAKQCNETLFDQYIRLLRGLMPKTFVAENVSGLKLSGYRVKAQLLDAQWLGVPQMRQRIIFVGVRDDLGVAPAYPVPLSYRYSVREALPWINRVRKSDGSWEPGHGIPSPAIGASDASRNQNAHLSAGGWIETVTHPAERRKFTIAELKHICAFPDDFELKGTYAQQWERLGNSVPPLMMKAVAETIRDRILVHCTGKQYGTTRASA